MATENFVEDISATFSRSANAGSLFGEPFIVANKTILPVAKISYGFGGGFGRLKKKMNSKSFNQVSETDAPSGQSSGGGGGLVATARGVFEVTPTSTRFIPAFSLRHFAAGLVAGLLLKTLLTGRRKN